MLKYINIAAQIALPTDPNDPRTFLIGAVGLRSDGVIVSARNGAIKGKGTVTLKSGWCFPSAHAEVRCSRKMDYNGVVYVARVSSSESRELMLARPCRACLQAMRARKIKKVYYSVSSSEYGVIDLSSANEPEWRKMKHELG